MKSSLCEANEWAFATIHPPTRHPPFSIKERRTLGILSFTAEGKPRLTVLWPEVCKDHLLVLPSFLSFATCTRKVAPFFHRTCSRLPGTVPGGMGAEEEGTVDGHGCMGYREMAQQKEEGAETQETELQHQSSAVLGSRRTGCRPLPVQWFSWGSLCWPRAHSFFCLPPSICLHLSGASSLYRLLFLFVCVSASLSLSLSLSLWVFLLSL